MAQVDYVCKEGFPHVEIMTEGDLKLCVWLLYELGIIDNESVDADDELFIKLKAIDDVKDHKWW